MSEQSLPDFVINAEPLQTGSECVSQIMNPGSPAGFPPILLKCPLVGPSAKDPAE
jgi:hypothetical protein